MRTVATERDQLRQQLQNCQQQSAVAQQSSSKQNADLRVEITTFRTNFENCRQRNEGLAAQIRELTQQQPNINKLEEEKSQLNSRLVTVSSQNTALTQ